MENRNLKPLSKMQLANAYNISLETLNSWLKPFKSQIGEYRGRLFTPKQVKIIFEQLGEPDNL